MIIASDHGEVRYFRMTRREVARLVTELGVRECVTTLHHIVHCPRRAAVAP